MKDLLTRLNSHRNLTKICTLVVLSMFLTGPVQADVRILLDVSKSMAENDPQNYRSDALQMLAESIPTNEKAGIWTFGQYVNLLVPHQPVSDSWREQARQLLEQQGAPALRTNMGRALEDASYDFLFSNYKAPVHVILITDGRVDIAPNTEVNGVERERILTQLVPKYIAAGARIHTIALSEKADHAMLKQMSEQTGGQYHKVLNSKNLTHVLADLASEVSPMSQLQMTQKTFDVDPSVREITVLMYHEKGSVSLVAPNGSETSAISPGDQRWRVGNGYTQVTVNAPLAGRWQVKGDLQDNSNIRVISDVNLSWVQPEAPAVARGNLIQVEARLVDGDGNSIARDLSSIVTADLRVNGSTVPVSVGQDSITARIVPKTEATTLNIELNINGGTFNRLMTRQIRFVEPYVSEVLLTESGYQWRLYPNRYLENVEDMNAQAIFERDGKTIEQPFELTPAGYWLWQLPYDSPEGDYLVQLGGDFIQMNTTVMLPPESIQLSIPPQYNQGIAMTPDVAMTSMAPETAEQSPSSGEFVKDPMPEFAELQADLVVDQPVTETDEWMEDPLAADSNTGSGLNLMTYVLLSLPGILILVVAYLFYRRIEQKAKVSASEDELLLGGDEFSGLDDMNALEPDSDLDISAFDDEYNVDEPLAPAPTIDDVEEVDLPTPQQTEAPSPAVEDMLDAGSTAVPEPEDTEADPEEELFDISSIDDDLADLDLALDGDDPFADAEIEDDEK